MPISDTGVILEPSATALAEAQQIFINTFGPNVNLDASSPNGLLIQNIAIAITYRENDQVYTVNSLNPNIAAGVQLDAICANLNIVRAPATNSTASVVVTGLSGVVIPNGTQVSSTNNDIFLVTGAITIGSGGTGTGTVTAQVAGPIAVTANTIINIINGVSGWDTINNPTLGQVGTSVQSDDSLRQTRINQLATASSGSYNAVLAGAQNLMPTPTSIYLKENSTGSPIVVDGVTISANSILLVLDTTASPVSIAEMLFTKLSAGCAMSGNTSYTYPIPNSSETFVATWEAATQEALVLNVTLRSGSSYPVNPITAIETIINDNFNFDVIGQFIYANDFVNILYQNGFSPILSLTFNVGATTNLTEYTMPINQSLGSAISSVVLNYG